MFPEEIIAGLERRVAALEEEFSALLRVLRYAEDLDTVRLAAESSLRALEDMQFLPDEAA